MIKSKITDKFQTTIPKEIRKKMKLSRSDNLEWQIEQDKVIVKPLKKPFLKYKGFIRVGKGNIDGDIEMARKTIAETEK